MEILQNLTAEEQQQLKDAIAYITVLVAGADGEIDAQELAASQKLTAIRSFSFHDELVPYYQEVKVGLEDQLHSLIAELPEDLVGRQQAISARLEQLNPILAKLSTHHAHVFYDGFVSFAKHVAKASGGVVGFMSIGPEEKQVVDLPMLHPILKD